VKRIAILGAIAIVVALVWHLRAPAGPPEPAAVRTGSARARGPVEHVTTLANADQRRDVADRIASGQASRAHAAPPRPSLPPIAAAFDVGDPEAMKQTVHTAMHEVVMHLVTCYESSLSTRGHAGLDIVAHLTLTGDPDIGTLIDAPRLVDDRGAALPAKLDDCLRSVLQSLELPPLAEGDHVTIDYPLKFRAADEYLDDTHDNGDDDDDDHEL
jgi:hypothetical protein